MQKTWSQLQPQSLSFIAQPCVRSVLLWLCVHCWYLLWFCVYWCSLWFWVWRALVYGVCCWLQVKEFMEVVLVPDSDIVETVQRCHRENNYLICPHTATALSVAYKMWVLGLLRFSLISYPTLPGWTIGPCSQLHIGCESMGRCIKLRRITLWVWCRGLRENNSTGMMYGAKGIILWVWCIKFREDNSIGMM